MSDPGLQRVIDNLSTSLSRDILVQGTVSKLREFLQVDRVVIYYFYCEWEGQVTFESLSSREFSIFGSTGPDECFTDRYAVMYQAGRVRAIPNIATEPIHPCHRDFLQNLQVQANLAVPVLNLNRLWGLLIAHHCQSPRLWSPADIQAMQKGAHTLATAPSIREN